MNYVQAFITNISFPDSINELSEIGIRFDMERILGVMLEAEEDDEMYCQAYGWTVPRWAKTGDIVFFFHAKTANARISRLVTELNREKEEGFEENQYWWMMNSLNRAKSIWREYGGKVFAIGRVSGHIYLDSALGASHWRSTIFAPIDSIFVLEKPIDISEFNAQIMVSRQSAITPVFGKDFEYLKSLIIKKNKYVWNYFKEAVSQPIPLSKMTRDNWLTVVNPYRRSFILEAQFRSYYVDYLLPLLGDKKRFYKECRCRKKNSNLTRVDNVIHLNGSYLAVEVKLNIKLEKDLLGQCDQYMFVDEIDLAHDLTVNGKDMMPYVMVIDTEDVYIYNGNHLDSIFTLDELKNIEDTVVLRKRILQATHS